MVSSVTSVHVTCLLGVAKMEANGIFLFETVAVPCNTPSCPYIHAFAAIRVVPKQHLLQPTAGRILSVSFSCSLLPFSSSSTSTALNSITLHDHASHFQPAQPLLQVSHCSSFVVLPVNQFQCRSRLDRKEHCGTVVVTALPVLEMSLPPTKSTHSCTCRSAGVRGQRVSTLGTGGIW